MQSFLHPGWLPAFSIGRLGLEDKEAQIPRRYWLFKSEPESFSIDHLAAMPDQTAPWDGVRNYTARNLLRDDVQVDDLLFFYHSSTKLTGIAGICSIARAAYPDPSAWNPESPYFDPKSSPDKPRWVMVDIKLIRRFAHVFPLPELRTIRGLEQMMLLQRGSRLSIQPVTAGEWKIIEKEALRKG